MSLIDRQAIGDASGAGPLSGCRKKGVGLRYQSVTEDLRRQLGEGSWEAGIKLPTLRQLAEQFKVSTNTVRNAIRVLEQEGHLYHVPAVGTFVRPVFPPVRAATDQPTVALLTTDVSSPFEMDIARGVEQACQERAWRLQFYDDRSDVRLEMGNLARLRDSGARGAIVLPTAQEQTIESLFKLKLEGFPLVLVDRSIFGLKVDLVTSDHAKGAYLATEHLIQQGHRRVLMVTVRPMLSSVEARIRGYERALTDHGIGPLPQWKVWYPQGLTANGIEEDQRWAPAYKAVLPVLKTIELPVGVFALHSYSGWGVIEACRELGLHIPDQVSIVCFDTSEITRALSPPMTTIGQHTLELGRRAVELLERRLQSPRSNHSTLSWKWIC